MKAVDLFRAVGDGRIKALWIMATNPAVSLPDAGEIRRALGRCPFVVVSDVERHTDTTAFANVLLPSASWGEKDGTVTNSERRISRQRAFMPVAGDARPDWWQVAEVARRLGFSEQFAWNGPDEIFAEYAALTGYHNRGTRDLDLSALAECTATAYQQLEPFQWPRPAGASWSSQRLFGDGRFFTPDGRACFVPTRYRPPVPVASSALVLNTGRIRDQWHTMTRTARSPRLSAQIAEPFIEINPRDAMASGVQGADLVMVSGHGGTLIVRAIVTDRVAEGSVFMPMHWSGQFASSALTGTLLEGHVDPVSGQPGLKHGAVRIAKYPARWYAFAAAASKPAAPSAEYWALARSDHGWRLELGAPQAPDVRGTALLNWLWPQYVGMEVLSYEDPARGELRHAVFDGHVLLALLYEATQPASCDRTFVLGRIGKKLDAEERAAILSGYAGSGAQVGGPIVCACLGVGLASIRAAIAVSLDVCTVDMIGSITGAGTCCGSCRPEIKSQIEANGKSSGATAERARRVYLDAHETCS